MQNMGDLSPGSSNIDESSDTDDQIIGYYPPGSKVSSSKKIWESLVDSCKRSIASKFNISKGLISMDLDAYSFVVSAEKINPGKKQALKEFLLSIGGTSFGRCSFPTRSTGSKTKDSIFGCTGNESQHLPLSLRGHEMLVIDTPVKIALHTSCQTTLIENLKSKGFYYLPSSKHTGVCFNPYAAANKPPYAVIVDAIINSSEVTSLVEGNAKSTNIIHVADMGFRSPLSNNYKAIYNLFNQCKKMEQEGITVEITQFDIAFGFQAPQDHLIQATCKVNEIIGKDSLFQKSRATVYPLHKLPKFTDAKLKNNDLRGTFEIKKTNWETGRDVILDDENHTNGINLFCSSTRTKNLKENITIHSSTLHSVKGYPTVIHSLSQKRSKFPMDDKTMYGIGNRKFEYIQTLIANLTQSLNETYRVVKSHGIGFRIEVSIRPHFNDPLRYTAHCNDLLLIVCITLQELFGSKFTLRLNTFPSRSVETEAMKLLSEASSMMHYRKEIRFNQVYKNEKFIEWLRFHLSITLITIGICPGYSIKYINQWLNDEDRFDPHNKVIQVDGSSESVSLSLIQHRMLHSFENHMKQLKFSESAVHHLRMFLKEAPNIDPTSCYSSLSLRSKHLLVSCLLSDIIPHLSEFLSSDKNKTKVVGKEIEQNDRQISDLEYEEILELMEPSEINSDKILQDLMKNAPMPVHPLAVALMSLYQLSLLWNPNRHGFNQILFHYIKGCHDCEHLGYDKITDQKTSSLIHNCLKGSQLSRNDFRHICFNLIPRCPMRNQSIISYQKMLCKQYQYPFPDVGYTGTGNHAERKFKNDLMNAALNLDISVLLVQDTHKASLHRLSDNSNVEVIPLNRILRPSNEFIPITIMEHHNLYYIMSTILHSRSESQLRQILFDMITRSKKRLQDIFLTCEAITSQFFKKIDTLDDLERAHMFSLRKLQDTIPNFLLSARCNPEIIFSLISYVYQKSIVYHDALKETTCVYMYWKSRCIKYSTKGCNWFPVTKSIIVRLDEHKIFKHQQITELVFQQPAINRDASELFSLAPIGGRLSSEVHLNLIPNRKRTSAGIHMYSALSKLLNTLDERYLKNSDHGNWNSDCLSIKSFILELSRSRETHHQCFHDSVISNCDSLDAPLRGLASLLFQNDSIQFTHKLLCPLICLKHHNLVFGIFDYNQGKKETHFYAHNPFLNMVETKKYQNYVRLLDRNQTLYLYSSPSRSEYFVPGDLQSSDQENSWRWDHSLNGKYSHLSLNEFEQCLDQLKVSFNAKVFRCQEELEDYNWRPEHPNCVIKSTEVTDQSKKLSSLSLCGVPQIALIIIFPTLSESQEWDTCIVHHPNQDEESALNHLLAFLEDSPSSGTYNTSCIKGSYVEYCESGYYMLLYAYLAIQTDIQTNFISSMNLAKEEPDLKMKCQQWIQATMRTQGKVQLPWLNQLICKTSPNIENDQSQDIAESTNEKENQYTNPVSRNASNTESISGRTSKFISRGKNKKRKSLSSNGNVHQQQNGDFVSPNSNMISHCCYGLQNPSNLCYMNVIIQLLYGMKCIRDHVSQINYKENNQNITQALRSLFQRMSSEKGTSSVMDFKNTFRTHPLFQEYTNNHQQDSHQFLLTLLQAISDEFTLQHKNSRAFWFRSTLVSLVRCQSCNKVSTNQGDHSISIEIEISGNCLEECLTTFFSQEEIEIENQWYCQNCRIARCAIKQLFLRERPILIITMKRFTGSSKKVTANVTFPLENLTIQNLVHTENMTQKKTRFKLFAVVNHLGTSATSGHYTLYMKVKNNWLKFDDESVTPIRQERVNSSNAYTLVYIDQDKFNLLGS
jgi:ubiquitin C-terminal hydrolase